MTWDSVLWLRHVSSSRMRTMSDSGKSGVQHWWHGRTRDSGSIRLPQQTTWAGCMPQFYHDSSLKLLWHFRQTTTKRKSNIYDRRWTGLTAGCLPQNSKVKNVLAFVKCLDIFFTWSWWRCLLVSNGLVGKRHEDWGACNLHLANGKFTRDVAYFLMYTRFSEKTNATI